MQYNGRYKVGKISKYDGYIGEIITASDEYYFTKDDIVDESDIENNDLVFFNSKSEDVFPQAYYVKKIGMKNTVYKGKE